jgi:alpha-L-fucosidase
MRRALALLVALSASAAAQESPAQRDARMAWWRDARFGMFIHWGAYAVPAGVYKGQPVRSAGEWIMNTAQIPVTEYEAFARAFNPVKYDPEAWVRIAKGAGMKYIIITSKHHDGFAIFDSKISRYDIVDAAPYRRDAIKALADAAKRQGIRFGVYYSIMDWHHSDAQAPNAPDYNSRTAKNPRFRDYVDRYMMPQLEELLRQYANIDVLWFDGEWIADWNDDLGRMVQSRLRAIRPTLIINNRVGRARQGMSGFAADGRIGLGDFGTPEQEVPPNGLPGVDWETCMTMNETWGFKTADTAWKDTRTLVRTLIDVASKGGNFLLNVGPTGEGLIPGASVERLRGMGEWMRANGVSIYGTSASPYGKPAWGRYTAKGSTIYAHVFDWPASGSLELTGFTSPPTRASILGGATLPIERSGGRVTVRLPSTPPNAIASVIVLERAAR